MQGDVTEPALAAVGDVGHAADAPRLLTVLGGDEHGALLFRDQHAPVRKEGEGPGLVEGGNLLHLEGVIHLRVCGRRYEREQPNHKESSNHLYPRFVFLGDSSA